MATTYTPLLELPKHDPADWFDITKINEGFDKIDAAMAKAYRGKAAHSLLDNGDFRTGHFIAQAGLNGLHGSTRYLGDRWIGNASTAATAQADGLLLSTNAQNSYIYQKVKVQAGKQYTFAIHATGRSGTHRTAAYNSNNSIIYAQDYAADRDTLLVTFTAGEDVVSMLYYPGYTSTGGSAVIQWAALYEGEYTADTLPEYQPKENELTTCRMFHRPIAVNGFLGFAVRDTDGYGFQGLVPGEPMRIEAPTIVGTIAAWDGVNSHAISELSEFVWTGNGYRIAGKTTAQGTPGETLGIYALSGVAINADL